MSDHKAEAEKIAVEIINGGPDRGGYLAEAQLHATLYAAEQTAELVKQQRIANLIAVTMWNDDALRADTPLRKVDGGGVDYPTERARVDRWFAEVREGLGLS